MNKCKQCQYEWEGKKEAKSCPRCKRYDWNKKNKEAIKNETNNR